ncbi:MAG TPA: 6-phosphogluconolactonase [Thermoanaerobaculia bacterium]|nr:6-phosphogluconolactonase [Thermoanaerobaculia bacterium]
MNLRIFDSAETLADAACDYVLRWIEGTSGRIAVALSGGSTPRLLYSRLGAEPARQRLATREIIWIAQDERFVPPDHPESNAGMIRESLFARGMAESHRFLRFPTEIGDPERVAERFEEQWRALDPGDIEIGLFGVGEDGHTASLFPGTPILEIDDRIAAAVYVERLDTWRLSLTLPVLRGAKQKVILAAGEGKKAIIERVREGEELPIVLVGSLEPDAWWFIDRAAYPE